MLPLLEIDCSGCGFTGLGASGFRFVHCRTLLWLHRQSDYLAGVEFEAQGLGRFRVKRQ